MPIIDIPLEELKCYRGVSPCPKDIDAFWDEAVEEMKAINPKTELIPSGFKCSFAECFDMYFYGVGGARIYAKYVKPKQILGKQPALVKFHGYSGSSGDWFDLLPYAEEGFHIAAMDCRGQAGMSQDNATVNGNTVEGHLLKGLDDGPKNLLYRSIFLDAAQLAGIIMDIPEVDNMSVGCFGISQGGALSLMCASLEPRMNRVVAQYPFLCDYRRIYEMDVNLNPYDVYRIKRWFRNTDPLHEREAEVFNTLSYIDIQNIVHRIQAHVLMITGLKDEVCLPSTQFAAYNNIKAKKEMLIYPDFGHEQLPKANDKIFKFMLDLQKR